MFVNLDNALSAAPANLPPFSVFELHPIQLNGWIEAVWETWRVFSANNAPSGGAPTPVVPALGVVNPGIPPTFAPPLLTALNNSGNPNGVVSASASNALAAMLQSREGERRPVRPWHHLIYAYLIENTRVVEIVRRVLNEALHDETFGAISNRTHQWLRTTEDLFFRDGPSGLMSSVTSWVRSDLAASRRTAYWSMFAMDLNHGADDGRPYPYRKAETANNDFVRTLEALLRELWRGFQNSTNISGPTATDPGAINEHIDRLRIMLNARRISTGAGGFARLAREELVFVSMMTWFHLTVTPGSPLVDDLRASGQTPEDCLAKLGERVKLPAHGKARSFFELANNLPLLLTMIEEGLFSGANAANQLLLFQTAGNLRTSVLNVITHWSTATGRDLKAAPTTVVAALSP